MGSEVLLEFEAWGDSDVGRCAPVGAGLPWGVGEGLCEELLRFEPTRFLKRAFMELMREEGGGLVRREGCGAGYLGAVLRLTASWARSKRRKLQGCVKESPPTRCGAVPELAGAAGGQAKYPRA